MRNNISYLINNDYELQNLVGEVSNISKGLIEKSKEYVHSDY